MAVTHHFVLAASLFLLASSFHIPLHTGRRSQTEGLGRSLQVAINETEIAVTDTNDMFYYGVVNFGTPPQPVKLLLDTSRAWTWVPSSKCGNPCATTGSFDTELSSTFYTTTTYRQLDFQNGVTTGYIVSDAVSIGDDSNGYVTTPSMSFLLVDYIWGNVDAPFDGTLGLAFGTYLGGASTFFDTLLAYGVVDKRIFSLYMGKIHFSGTGENSGLTVGYYDLEKYSDEDVLFLPVYKAVGLWSLQLAKVTVGSDDIVLVNDLAVLNSTSYTVSMPSTDYAQVIASISSAGACSMNGMLICDCGMAYSINSYPDIVMTLGTRRKYRLKSTDYFHQKQDGCHALLSENADNQWVLGLPFMRAYYTIYDMDNELIGLARSLNGSGAGALAAAGLLILLWGA